MASSVRKWVAESPPVEWIVETSTATVKDLMLGALRQGPVPQHIAFVMDGNRRFARSHKKEVVEGHSAGFEALARTLEICYKIGVKVVTVYAFSIENFKRTKYEVDALMDMAKSRLGQMAQHGHVLAKYGCKMQMLGKREMVRPDVLEAIDKAIEMTKHNNKAILNICAPYTSREEIATAVRDTVADYCEPVRPKLRRPFSETHIARNIQAHRQENGLKGFETDSPAGALQQQLQKVSTENEGSEEEEYFYKPSTAGTTAAYQDLLKNVSALLDAAADEHTATADESVISGATASILYYLKDTSLSPQDKLVEVNDIIGSDISDSKLQELQKSADQLYDYSPPVEKTLHSDSTTLHAGTDATATPPQPPPKYRDPESITEDTLTENTYTGLHTPPLELLIRTSGVERLSDFMLWQGHQNTEIAFVDCYWPEFGLKHFIPILLEYQWKQKKATYWKENKQEPPKYE